MKNIKLAVAGIAILGLAVLPLSGVFAADQSTNVTINATVAEIIGTTISSDPDKDGAGTLDIGNVVPGTLKTATDNINIVTNAAGGYTLAVRDADATTALTHTSGSGTGTIAASAGTFASPIALANNTWGLSINGTSYFGITASDVVIASTVAPTEGHATTITYGVLVDSSKASGLYTDNIIYTITTR